MRVPMNDPRRTYASISESITNVIDDVVRSGWYLLGEQTERFEAAFAEYVGAMHCVGVANGTDALELALRALGIEPGDQIITVTNAGGYTLNAVAAIDAVPVFVDVDPHTLTLDLDAALHAVDRTTKAVVATHLFGHAVDVSTLRHRLEDAGRADIVILEDAAQAHGAAVADRKVGALGDAACFSFYPTKNLGALGDAGAVTTSRDDVANRLRALHQYGWTQRYVSTVRGGRNSRMDEVQAAVLNTALPHLDAWNQRRRSIVTRYSTATPDGVCAVHASDAGGDRFVAHLAVLRTKYRDALIAHLAERGIATAVHYPVLDTDVPWLAEIEHVATPTPSAELARAEILSVPCFPALTDDEVDHVCAALAGFGAGEVSA